MAGRSMKDTEGRPAHAPERGFQDSPDEQHASRPQWFADDSLDQLIASALWLQGEGLTGPDCPSELKILDYVKCESGLSDPNHIDSNVAKENQDLGQSMNEEVRVHITACQMCRSRVVKARAETVLADHLLSSATLEALVESLGAYRLERVSEEIRARKVGEEHFSEIGKIRELTAHFKDHLITWVSPLWKPRWAGEVPTAADNPEQQHCYRTDDGYIEVSCFWRSAEERRGGYIGISWRAQIAKPSEFWIRFIEPELEQTYSELFLGTGLVGEEFFLEEELGFDPWRQKWAISIVLKRPGS